MTGNRRSVTDNFGLKPIMTTSRRRKAQRAAEKRMCGVYFFEASGSNLVKIGRSSNIERRIAEAIDTAGAPDAELSIWGVVECSKENLVPLERAMHRAFTGTRVAGEWFEARKDLVMHKAIEVAREVCGDNFNVRGLGTDATPAAKPNWRDPADNAAMMKKRAIR